MTLRCRGEAYLAIALIEPDEGHPGLSLANQILVKIELKPAPPRGTIP